jgi:hypothetical protein
MVSKLADHQSAFFKRFVELRVVASFGRRYCSGVRFS